MSTTITVSDEIARHLDSLALGGDDVEDKLRALLEAEYRRRLTRYGATDQRLRDKYGMTFEEFERQYVVRERSYSWEVESDAMEWDLAMSGTRTMRRKLMQLRGKESDEGQ